MIKLIKSYPYDNNYDYSKSFTSIEEQTQYFNSLPCIIEDEKSEYNETGYIKIGESFRVNQNYDFLVNEGVNYITFNNGYKNIYAFIVNKEYCNEETTLITYEIDVIQTFMFDFTVSKSFVERKVCSIAEITDFDEGLTIGEHEIKENEIMINKDSNYFAMFNGFKEQQLIFEGNVLKSVVDMPYSTSKPLTVIDGIQYPLYFMPLKESYKNAIYEDIGQAGGETSSGRVTAKIFRFIKGYEGFAAYPCYFNGESFRTGGYGVTETFQAKYFEMLGTPPYTEQLASEILAQMMTFEFAEKVWRNMLADGLIASQILNHKFDAFVSLSMNCGLSGCISSPMYKKYIANVNDTTIYDDWLEYRTSGATGVLPGLIARRKSEAEIFRDNNYSYRQIVTYDQNGNIDGYVMGNGHIPEICLGGV